MPGVIGYCVGRITDEDLQKGLAVEPGVVSLESPAFWSAKAFNSHGCLTLGRDVAMGNAYAGRIPIYLAPGESYLLGYQFGQVISSTYALFEIQVYIGLNEPDCSTDIQAVNLGAFDAGFAMALGMAAHGAGIGNWSMGRPEGEWFAKYIATFWSYYKPELIGMKVPLFLLYHGYGRPESKTSNDNRYWYEERPYTEWVCYTKLPIPPIIYTEAGIDMGPDEAPNHGWRGSMNVNEYGNYIDYIASHRYAYGYCLFIRNPNNETEWKSFECNDADLDRLIRGTNNRVRMEQPHWIRTIEEGEQVATLTNQQIWDEWQKRWSIYPALSKYLAQHPEYGEWADPVEHYYIINGKTLITRGTSGGGLVACWHGDWGNIKYCKSIDELPLV
jgi:hypothetical protein